jgi:PBP1b-binding outer membrane lipoprotein LpoB
MKYLLLTTIAAVVLVGCGESQQSVPPAEAEPAEPVAEAANSGEIPVSMGKRRSWF